MSEKQIQILPDFIANQIAAGEVVQRPSSVVKELVENSLDANADSIAVIVKDAGKKLIHVVDNGTGMTKSDLELSVQRHATSKVMSQEDLESIKTFGFRGEALASISAVSLLDVRTKRKNDKVGWQLIAEPNKEIALKPVSIDTGTQISVRNLFYNVPARKKFLRANLTEFRHISDTMIKFALSNPDVRFTFYDDDTLIFDVKPSNLNERIDNVLGENSLDTLMEITSDNDETDPVKISGYIGYPQSAKQSRSGQYFFLNKRAIYSKSLSHAVFSAYEQLLEKNRQPVFIINILLDPVEVDINVHPQKNEVKFEDERYIYNLIKSKIKHTLQKNDLMPGINIDYDDAQSPFESMNTTSKGEESDLMIVNKMTGEIIESKKNDYNDKQNEMDFSANFERDDSDKSSDSAFDEIFGKEDTHNSLDDNKDPLFGVQEQNDGQYLQIHNKYIVYQSEEGMIIIDQHNAHERILYEKAIKAMNREFKYSQEVLFPVQIKLNSSNLSIFKEISEELQNLGFVFDFKKDDVIQLNALPSDIRTGDEKNALMEILEEYEENQNIRHTDKRDNLAASYSCKSAIKTGKKMTINEMKRLKENLFECELPYVCPHGRPVVLEFKIKELDNKFGRSKDHRF